MKIHEKETLSDYKVKPRKTKGTQSYRVRNYVAASLLLAGSLLGFAYAFLPSTDKVRKFAQLNLFPETESQRNQRAKLQPYTENNDLQSSQILPVILSPNDPVAIEAAMNLLDPLHVKSDQ